MQRAVGVVLDQPGAGPMRGIDKSLPGLDADHLAGRIGEVRNRVGELRTLDRRSSVEARVVDHHVSKGRRAWAPSVERAEIGGKLSGDQAAFFQQHLADQIQALHAAGGHDDVGARQGQRRRAEALCQRVAQLGQSLDRGVA